MNIPNRAQRWTTAALIWSGPMICLGGSVHAWFIGEGLAAYWAFVCMLALLTILAQRRTQRAETRKRSQPKSTDIVDQLEHWAADCYARDYSSLGSSAIAGAPETMLEAADQIRRMRRRFGT